MCKPPHQSITVNSSVRAVLLILHNIFTCLPIGLKHDRVHCRLQSREYHQALQKSQLKGIVHPTFRPDKAMNIFKPDFADYVKTLGNRWNIAIKTIDDLLAALKAAHDFFAENGCVASDHGVAVPYGLQVAKQDAEAVFQKALARSQPKSSAANS